MSSELQKIADADNVTFHGFADDRQLCKSTLVEDVQSAKLYTGTTFSYMDQLASSGIDFRRLHR